MRKFMLAMFLSAALGGCASAGNQVLKDADANTVSQQITNGKTTKSEVRTAFGDPSETSFTDSGNEIWKYVYAHSTLKPATLIPIVGLFAGGADVHKKELVILFDKNGTVVNHTMQDSNQEVRNGG